MGRRTQAGQSAEQRTRDRDEAAQERGSSEVRAPRVAPGYVKATHPDTGVRVTFTPDEALPAWVDLKGKDTEVIEP